MPPAPAPRRLPDPLRLGERLLRDGAITREQLEEALREQSGSARRLGRILVARGHVDELTVLATIAGEVHLQLAALARDRRPDPRQVASGLAAPSPP